MRIAEAISTLQGRVPPGVRLEEDDLGHLVAFVRRDMLHLDADALSDRLAAWTRTRLAHALPRALATISFRHARAVDPHDESTLDLQEGWLNLEPSVWIEGPQVSGAEVDALAALLPEFVGLLEGRGRPSGWRRHDEGNAE